jgi:hypothetical protein
LAGRSGGQTLTGGTAASNTLVLRSTSNATKGQVYIDETTASTSTTTGALRVAGGAGIGGSLYAGDIYSNGVLVGVSNYTAGTNIDITSSVISVISNPSFSGAVTMSSYTQMNNILTPANPASNNYRLFFNTSTNLLSSINSIGQLTTYQPATTKGDIVSFGASTQDRLPVGNNNDKLIADSTQALGLRWVPSYVYFYIRDVKTTGTNGGTATAGAFFNRTLNQITAFPTGNTTLSLSADVVTFPAGTYYVHARCPSSGNVNAITSRLFDNVNNVTIILGSSARSSSNNGSGETTITGMFTLSATTDIVLQMRVTSTVANTGLGIASGFQTEVYSTMTVCVLQS